MCQLLGMNCNTPTDICFSFTGFQARGGLTDVHTDGWGIAFFEGKGVRQFLDPLPSAHSPVAELVRGYPIKSENVIAHIRKATQGRVALENTHPFQRELWGFYWVFAHNGNIEGVAVEKSGSFLPVGDTDSERIFCTFLEGLRLRFPSGYPGARQVFESIHEMSLPLAARGELNFLLSNGEFLIAHGSTNLSYIVRQAPFAEARLKDQEVTVDFSAVTTEKDRVAVIATQPLTDNERWECVEPGSLVLFQEGAVVDQRRTSPGPAHKIRLWPSGGE
jgi:glutamine amidotransferase